jgi:hypothetical protein
MDCYCPSLPVPPNHYDAHSCNEETIINWCRSRLPQRHSGRLGLRRESALVLTKLSSTTRTAGTVQYSHPCQWSGPCRLAMSCFGPNSDRNLPRWSARLVRSAAVTVAREIGPWVYSKAVCEKRIDQTNYNFGALDVSIHVLSLVASTHAMYIMHVNETERTKRLDSRP